jgi:hypothetical protein
VPTSISTDLLPVFRQLQDPAEYVDAEPWQMSVTSKRYKLDANNLISVEDCYDGATKIFDSAMTSNLTINYDKALINLASVPSSVIMGSYYRSKYSDVRLTTMITQALSTINKDFSQSFVIDPSDPDEINPVISLEFLSVLMIQSCINLIINTMGSVSRFQRGSVSISRDAEDLKAYQAQYKGIVDLYKSLSNDMAIQDGEYQTFWSELLNPISLQIYPFFYGAFWSRWAVMRGGNSPYLSGFNPLVGLQ